MLNAGGLQALTSSRLPAFKGDRGRPRCDLLPPPLLSDHPIQPSLLPKSSLPSRAWPFEQAARQEAKAAKSTQQQPGGPSGWACFACGLAQQPQAASSSQVALAGGMLACGSGPHNSTVRQASHHCRRGQGHQDVQICRHNSSVWLITHHFWRARKPSTLDLEGRKPG